MTLRVDIDRIETSDDGYGTLLLEGKPFSGIAYELDPDTSRLVSCQASTPANFTARHANGTPPDC